MAEIVAGAVGLRSTFGVAVGETDDIGVGVALSGGTEACAGGGETISIGVGRGEIGGGVGIVTPAGGLSTWRWRGLGLIGRTGSIKGACGRERGDCAGYTLGEAIADGTGVVAGLGVAGVGVGIGVVAALDTGGVSSADAEALGVEAGEEMGVVDGDAETVGVGEGVGDVFFFVEVLCFLCGVGDGPAKNFLTLSPNDSSSTPRAWLPVTTASVIANRMSERSFIGSTSTFYP